MTAGFAERIVTSWGQIERLRHPVARPRYRDELPRLAAPQGEGGLLAVGLGRSYGDTVLNPKGSLLDMTGLDRIIAFDAEAGILRAEAGLSLDDALTVIVPHGWFFATTPGTRFVTLGGAVANDIHGKNHHGAGSFGCSVRRFGLLRSDGSEHVLERDKGDELFRATLGGLGLTGIITWVEVDLVRIPSASLAVERYPFENVEAFFRIAEESIGSHEHTVAWIDCANADRSLGRGIFQRANWDDGPREPHRRKPRVTMPLEAPSFALNSLTIRAFNAAYHRLQAAGPARTVQHYDKFLYPLDAIGQWNRLYGSRGFYQYQCVFPPEDAAPAVAALVREIARGGGGSFLAVLKTFGARCSGGLLTFPMPGATLALDFPNKGRATLDLLARLDEIVLEARGRLYPAKDGRMPARMFQAGYGAALPTFERQRDPALSSQFWRRVTA